MKAGQRLWTREELILAINQYCKMPFGKMHASNPDIILLANLIGRTPASVALKLGNFASFDPTLKARGIKGASNASKLDRIIWDEFYTDWEGRLLESEKLLAEAKHTTVEKLNDINIDDLPKEGIIKERLVKTRVNQCIFRKIVLATYNNKCCITGIDRPELLIASHISSWSKDEKNRMNPMNGLALNALHDKAFETGLITINENYRVVVSQKLKKAKDKTVDNFFLPYEGKEIALPDKFLPSKELLRHHAMLFNFNSAN